MKTHLSFIVIVALSISAIAQQKTNTYAIKSGYAKYELSGSTTGTKEIWWDNYGRYSHELVNSSTVIKMFGIKEESKSHTLTILKDDKLCTVDYSDNTGTNGNVPYYNESHKMVEQMSEEELEEFADDMLAQFGGERLGNEDFMGYSCEVIKVMGVKIWIYKGITLKSESNVMGIKSIETCISFKPEQSISASKFTPPTGITYTKMQQEMPTELWGDMDDSDYNSTTAEDMKQVKMIANMPYEDFKAMVLKEDPEMKEEEIKEIYKMSKAFSGQ